LALAAQYLDRYPFNKLSTRELHEQIIKRLLLLKWRNVVAIEIEPKELKAWFLGFDVDSATRGKYKSVMSGVYTWGQCEGLIPRGEQYNPCRYVKGREFSHVSSYEALALEVEDTLRVLSELQQPEYELALLVATCGLRISEALGLRWRDILWDRGVIAIRQTFVHLRVQEGAKTKLSRSRVEAPKLLLDAFAAWRKETMYAEDQDYVFPSTKLGGAQPRSASMLVEDYLRPAAIRAGVLKVVDGVTYGPDGDSVRRFGFHNLGRHSLATFLMDEGENPAVVQAIMRHAKLDMTLYYSHSRRKQKLAAQEKVLQRLLPQREPEREPHTIQ
jgi:integrase